MPENTVTTTETKKPDAPATAPGTPPTNEQKPPAAQTPQAPKTAAPAEKKPSDPPKEQPKAPPAPPTTPPPPPPKAPPKQPEEKGKATEPKQAETPKSPADGRKPTVAEKPGEKKPDAKDVAPPPKAAAPTEPKEPAGKKPEEKKSDKKAPATDPKPKAATEPRKPDPKAAPGDAAKSTPAADPKKGETAPPTAESKGKPATDPKKPEDKAPAADPKGKPVDTPKKEDAKGPITVSGKDKVEIPIVPKSQPEIGHSRAAAAAIYLQSQDKKEQTVPVTGETPLTPAQKGGQTRKEHNQGAKDYMDGKATIDGKPIEPLKTVPAGKPKAETAVGPAQEAEGPKGIVITQVFDDRLAPPSEADLKKLPIPKEGEAFSMRLHPAYFFEFLEHPFTINRETKDYKDLRESIKENGIRDPVYCRPRDKGGLEIISGHRRHDIGTELNYPIPTIIVQADDDTARIAVVDGNLHRMDIPTSELARAAKMKMEALTRKAGRRSKMEQLTSPQKRSDQQVADDMGMSRNQVQRLVRIDSLVPELKQQVDDKKLPFNTAVELSYMNPDEQKKVVDFMQKEQVTPSMAQATALKEASRHAETLKKHTPSLAPAHAVDEKKIASIIKPKKEPELKVTLTADELRGYFPDKQPTVAEAKRAIFDGLDMRKKALEKQAKKQDIKNPAR